MNNPQSLDALERSIRASIRYYRVAWGLVVLFVFISAQLKNVSFVEPLIVVVVMWVVTKIAYEAFGSLFFIVYEKLAARALAKAQNDD